MSFLPPVESFIKPNGLINSPSINEGLSFKITEEFVETKADDLTKMNSVVKPNLVALGVSYFWNYNACNKGPRKKQSNDNLVEYPHTSAFDYEDPIKILSDSETMSRSRKSEASSIIPNLTNFVKIRNNIEKLSSNYKDTVHKNGRISPKSRNMLASKICRMKKKAYHESLKIKYIALGVEHDEIVSMNRYLKQIRRASMFLTTSGAQELKNNMLIVKAAGRLDEFITDLLHIVDNGDLTNPVILKLTHNMKHDNMEMLHEQEPANNPAGTESPSIHFDELDFLMNDPCFNDFLNSSGSTWHTDDSSCLQ